MRDILALKQLMAAVVYSGIGVLLLAFAFMAVDKLTPYDLWEELVQKQNRALAQVVGSLSIGISIIIAAAMIG